MTKGRIALVATCVGVAGLAGWFTIARWDDANKVAAAISALGAVAAIGVAVWAAVRSPTSATTIRVSRTGAATAHGSGRANTGFRGNAPTGSVSVERTGDADASGQGDANTGVDS
ncbi:hypothetical protein ACIOD2_00090 [Amycolatopsis sp. NPDC088138]|uniref:hypothetical protein n=1 Tax=Amycolatopsis sp. NPDC088138 TaxID=3363938 RepID=UPI00382D0C39